MKINDEAVRQVLTQREKAEQEEAAARAYEEEYRCNLHRVALGAFIVILLVAFGALAGAFAAGYHKARIDALNEYAPLIQGEVAK